MNIVAPPVIMPASAPHLFVRFQKSAHSTTGPNTAPKPAQANETILKTELFGSLAKNTAITEITTTESLARSIDFFCDILTPKVSCTIFCEIAEAAARSCESAVDIVEAKIPAKIIPPTNAGT